MTIRYNQQLPHNHFRKDWQRRVRTHFDQPGKKQTRRNARVTKAAKLAPRPVDKLRPAVRCPTVKYNMKLRAGRGFSIDELKAAGIARKYAQTIGISVDGRRQNLSEESLAVNVQRLKEYISRLVVFPRRAGKVKKGDSSKADTKAILDSKSVAKSAHVFPIVNHNNIHTAVTEVSASSLPKGTENAYRALRDQRSEARYQGQREKRAKAKAEKEDK